MARFGSNLFDTQMVFLKDFFLKVDLKKSADEKINQENLSRVQRVNHLLHNNSCDPFEI